MINTRYFGPEDFKVLEETKKRRFKQERRDAIIGHIVVAGGFLIVGAFFYVVYNAAKIFGPHFG